ncbi:MAG: hypothetical protein EOM54_15230 [Clostridia bacterium]|nr:hypothetical protein [Clostridia bacterium]
MEILGADLIGRDYHCSVCGYYIGGQKTNVIGIFEQKGRYGEIRVCPKCNSAIQVSYEKKVRHAG